MVSGEAAAFACSFIRPALKLPASFTGLNMRPYLILRSLYAVLCLGMTVSLGLWFFTWFICSQLSTEARFRKSYGADWRLEYEKTHGSLTQAHVKVGVSVVGIVAIALLSYWLYASVKTPKLRRSERRRSHERRFGSNLERIMYYRRNALLAVYFGVGGILFSLLLMIFRLGIFSDHDNEMVLGIFVFLCGYSGVIAGCRWWLRAKAWNEAVAFIALMPLGILLIPFVRLVFVAVPLLLPAAMVMMPLILVVVVFVLPDKSEAAKRKVSRKRG